MFLTIFLWLFCGTAPRDAVPFLSTWCSIMLIYSLIVDDCLLPMMVDVAYDRFCLCIYCY